MYDKDLAIDILSQIYQATLTIIKRFSSVKTVSDFTDSEYGVEKLDSICMLLIAIGESGIFHFPVYTFTNRMSVFRGYCTGKCKVLSV
ncbi:hypothetical protein MTBBW1_2130039 [Desulfamplus magnetovallimortis]|uniref:Uncharacterized protein n=1 Tax=Desulfamplus magnetovallimortis TaxID=1246637 RepID=A0A1W1HCC7_9BACT|nr:hypothetical protein MTBBW1_2130039 [Desulfamplus magnetovallimortis]